MGFAPHLLRVNVDSLKSEGLIHSLQQHYNYLEFWLLLSTQATCVLHTGNISFSFAFVKESTSLCLKKRRLVLWKFIKHFSGRGLNESDSNYKHFFQYLFLGYLFSNIQFIYAHIHIYMQMKYEALISTLKIPFLIQTTQS